MSLHQLVLVKKFGSGGFLKGCISRVKKNNKELLQYTMITVMLSNYPKIMFIWKKQASTLTSSITSFKTSLKMESLRFPIAEVEIRLLIL